MYVVVKMKIDIDDDEPMSLEEVTEILSAHLESPTVSISDVEIIEQG